MNDHSDPVPSDPPGPPDDADPVLSAAGARLRRGSSRISPSAVEVAVLRRRARRLGVGVGASLVAVALLGGLLVNERLSGPGAELASDGPASESVDRVLASLGDAPIDPTEVELVSTVSTFPDCDALVDDLRRVGAEHVGSRGFGSFGAPLHGMVDDGAVARDRERLAPEASAAVEAADESTTLGTNVQVAGVDELDFVKAAGNLVYDLDGRGNLRITDARTLEVLSTLDVTPPGPDAADDDGEGSGIGDRARVSDLLVADGRVAVFGSEVEVSEPVEGDPSATTSTTPFMTVAFVDASDPSAPTVTDRVRIEGSLVSARLVAGEIRLVTTSHMADLGFLMPTTPTSVAKALEQNRRSVASSTAPDWIPDWQRDGDDPEPLVPCERVHVPDTFSGVAMTSMVTFPLATGRFEPAATSILAPATTLYAGLGTVAISSEVWVDPIDRGRLEFDDWQTAIHEFRFDDGAAPAYVGSGIVDGSTVGQFAFGEIGDSLAVVTTEGTPWAQEPDVAIDLTILTSDGDGGLGETSKVADLADGRGEVTAVRFVDGRVLISTGFFGREVHVIDVTHPAEPRRAGRVTIPGTVGYVHPLPDHRALLVGSRSDEVGEGPDRQTRSWVQAHLLDVGDPDAPSVVGTWERPWVADGVAADHHAFTYWPDRELAMWGLMNTQFATPDRGNEAIVLRTDGGVAELAVPVASKPNEVPPPCPTFDVTDPEAREMIGPDDVVLRCDDTQLGGLEWPRYHCSRVDGGIVARFVPEEEQDGSFHLCSPAPPPTVSRVLVVAGTPILLTDQTLEALDPETFESTAIAYHPSTPMFGLY
ncbi:MAG: beta-propeller domain-containing protein [Acidimicrobiia bacterium]